MLSRAATLRGLDRAAAFRDVLEHAPAPARARRALGAALGAGLAAQVLHETKVLLASGGLVADSTFADAALALAASLFASVSRLKFASAYTPLAKSVTITPTLFL